MLNYSEVKNYLELYVNHRTIELFTDRWERFPDERIGKIIINSILEYLGSTRIKNNKKISSILKSCITTIKYHSGIDCFNQTLSAFLNEQKQELKTLYSSCIESELTNEFYTTIENNIKNYGTITKQVYDSLNEGQKRHFDRNYNIRGDKVKEVKKLLPEV